MVIDVLKEVEDDIKANKDGDEKKELSDSFRDKIRSLSSSIDDFNHSWQSFENIQSDLEKMGVDFNGIRSKVKDSVSRFLS